MPNGRFNKEVSPNKFSDEDVKASREKAGNQKASIDSSSKKIKDNEPYKQSDMPRKVSRY